MATITLTAPDGRQITLTPPPDATEADIRAAIDAVIEHSSQPGQAIPPPAEEEGPGLGQQVLATAASVGLPIAGGIAGAASPVPGGAYLGAAGGGMLGEMARRWILDEPQSARATLVAGPLSIVPGIKAAGVTSVAGRAALRAAEGAAQGTLATAAMRYLGEGEVPTPKELALGGLTGLALGAAGGAAEAKFGRVLPKASAADEVAARVEGSTLPPKPGPRSNPSEARQYSDDFFTVTGGFMKPPGAPETPPAAPMDPARIERAFARVDRLYGDRPEAARLAMKNIIANNPSMIEGQSRGTQPTERTKALAQDIFFDVRGLPKPGTTLNAERTWALADTVAALEDKTAQLAAKVAAGQNDDATKLALKTARQEMVVAQLAEVGNAAELGRALRVLRVFRNADITKDTDYVKKALKIGVPADDIVKMLEKTEPDDVVGRYRMLRDAEKPGFRDYLKWYWMTNVLSGPRTHMRNLIGNTMNLAYQPAATPFGAGLDWARVKVRGGERELYAGELGAQLMAFKHGWREALRRSTFMLKNGFSLNDIETLEIRPPEIPGGIATNLIGRALGAADEWFRTLAYHMELHSGAYQAARKQLAAEGIRGRALKTAMPERIATLLADPPPDLVKQSAKFAERVVFQQDAGKILRPIMQLRHSASFGGFAPLDFIIPFVKTPGNIIKEGVQASPLGFVTEAGREAGRAGAQARGRALLGSLALMPVAWLAAEERLSGSGPRDLAEKDALYATGWRPNSVRLPLPDALVRSLGVEPSPMGEYWINYSLIQPLSVPFSAVANAAEVIRDKTLKGESLDAPGMLGTVVAKVANSALQQSFLQGLSAVQNALADPDRWGQRFISGIARGFVPGSQLLSTQAQREDRVLRDPEGTLEDISRGIPTSLGPAVRGVTGGAITSSEQLPPRIRATGEPVVNVGNPMLVPEISPVVHDPLRIELHRLGMDLEVPQAKIQVRGKQIPFTEEQESLIKQAKGRVVRNRLSYIMQHPAYARMDDEKRKYHISKETRDERQKVHERVLALLRRQQPLTLEALMGGGT